MKSDIVKKFPAYFDNFEMPTFAKEDELEVYRACASGKVDRESFLNSYEENGFQVLAEHSEDDPQAYSLSTYLKIKDVRRFMNMTSKFNVPFVIAKGITHPRHGLCAITKTWKKTKSSHVDWWLYENARPWEEFLEVTCSEP